VSALGLACLCHCGVASAGEHLVAAEASAQCNNLTVLDQPGACIDVGHPSLGELFAISLDGSQPPRSLGILAPAAPASPSVLASAPASCADVLATPMQEGPVGVDLARRYALPSFTTQLSAGLLGLTATLNIDIANTNFNLELGPMTSSWLDDPGRLLSCNPEAVSAVGTYWASLSQAETENTGLFLVDTVITTDTRDITTSDGVSISLALSNITIAGYDISVSYVCAPLMPADASAPIFFDGHVFSYDPVTSAFSFAQSVLTCKAVE